MNEHSKTPPQAVELEEALLGALMIDTKSIMEVIDILKPKMFYKTQHEIIYSVIENLFSNSKDIDELIVANDLKDLGQLEAVGGYYGISLLTEKVGTAAHVRTHALIIQKNYILREVINSCHNSQKKAYDNDYSVIEQLSTDIEKLQQEISGVQKKDNFIEKVVKTKDDFFENNGKGITGILTGVRNFDVKMRGFDKTDLIVLAGRPGMGKTAFALDIANKIKENVLFFSLEMSTEQLIRRKVKAQLPYEVSERFDLNCANDTDLGLIQTAFENIGEDNNIIEDEPYMTPSKIRAKSKLIMMREDIDMIIIDYLQLMTDVGNNKNEEIGNITRKLKLLAKELNVPIILISQLSRAVEQCGGAKKPMLSDLRDSGSIEQDADIVLFCYRPEYYGITECSIDGVENCDTSGCFIIDFAKYRSGQTGDVYMKANRNITSFSDWEQNVKETVF